MISQATSVLLILLVVSGIHMGPSGSRTMAVEGHSDLEEVPMSGSGAIVDSMIKDVNSVINITEASSDADKDDDVTEDPWNRAAESDADGDNADNDDDQPFKAQPIQDTPPMAHDAPEAPLETPFVPYFGGGTHSMIYNQEDLTYDFTGQQDVVVLLDRSASIGFYDFEEKAKDFMETVLRSGFTIHPDYSRLAVITFAGKASIEFDGIKEPSLTACTLFPEDGLWDNIQYDPDEQDGAAYKAAIDEARSILSAGRLLRPNIPQSLWLIADGEYNTDELIPWASYVKDDGVKLFGAGMGFYLNSSKMRALVSSPTDYYYHETTDWLNIIRDGHIVRRNISSGQYERVDDKFCTNCGSGAACFCDTLSDRLPLCACQQHYYPLNDQCVECPDGEHKSAWGNLSCSLCTDESSFTGNAPDKCSDSSGSGPSIVIIVVIVIAGIVLLVVCWMLVLFYIMKERKKKNSEKKSQTSSNGSDVEGANTIYTQTYSTPESAKVLIGRTLNGRVAESNGVSTSTGTGPYPILAQQTSNMSTDSAGSMNNPQYVDPNSNPKLGKNQNYLHPPTAFSSPDYIDVMGESASDSDHEDPQTINKLSSKFRNRGRKKKKDPTVGAAGKTRMPSPKRENEYENDVEMNRLKRLKNRISKTFSKSNDYSNAEEINKLKKGRSSAKINAYQVKNIINLFEKTEDKDKTKKTATLPAKITTANGAVPKTHTALAKASSGPAPTASPPSKPLPKLNNRPISTISMDADGYMKPVRDPSKTATYIDLIPETMTHPSARDNTPAKVTDRKKTNSQSSNDSKKYQNIPPECHPPPGSPC